MKALAARVASRRSGESKSAKAASRKGGTTTAVLDDARADAETTVAEDLAVPTITSTGPRQQAKRNTSRSQRKGK
jgi:hypothetical protein